jgi:flagellar hook-length control protein FliK
VGAAGGDADAEQTKPTATSGSVALPAATPNGVTADATTDAASPATPTTGSGEPPTPSASKPAGGGADGTAAQGRTDGAAHRAASTSTGGSGAGGNGAGGGPRSDDAGADGTATRAATADDSLGAGRRSATETVASRGVAPTVPSAAPVAAPTPPSAPAASAAYFSPTPAPAPTAALEATLRMAGENGFTRARVTLRPAELGGVEVFLREGSAGLTATVVADTPHAAHLLQSSAAELQRRLAAQGLELASLQVSVGGESTGAAHGGHEGQGTAPTAGGTRDAAAAAAAPAEKTQTIELGGGVLVDVLA